MQHSFDVEIAKEYGIAEAILLNHLEFWIAKNKANNQNFYDGYYWTYNSTRAFNDLFPYLSQRQIQNALKHLREEGIIQTGNYNKLAYDRTLWYAFTEKGECIMQKCKMDYAEMSNGNDNNAQAIPDNKPVTKTDIKTDNINIIVEYLNSKAGTKYRASSKATNTHINARLSEGFTVDDFKNVIDKKCAEWIGTDFAQYLRPATLFGTKFEAYLNAPAKQRKTYGQNGIEVAKPENDDLAGIL